VWHTHIPSKGTPISWLGLSRPLLIVDHGFVPKYTFENLFSWMMMLGLSGPRMKLLEEWHQGVAQHNLIPNQWEKPRTSEATHKDQQSEDLGLNQTCSILCMYTYTWVCVRYVTIYIYIHIYIYILDSHMAPYGARGFVQSKVRSSEVSPNVRWVSHTSE